MTLTSRTGVKAEGIEGLFEALAAALFEDDAVVGEVLPHAGEKHLAVEHQRAAGARPGAQPLENAPGIGLGAAEGFLEKGAIDPRNLHVGPRPRDNG